MIKHSDPNDDSPYAYGTGAGKHAGPVVIKTYDNYPGDLVYVGKRRDQSPLINRSKES